MPLSLPLQLVRGARGCSRSSALGAAFSVQVGAANNTARTFGSSTDPGYDRNSGGAGNSRQEDVQHEHLSEDGPFQRIARWQTRCPFFVRRTCSDNLPVYLQKRLNGNMVMTVIRKVRGDDAALKKELEVLCQKKVHVGRSGYLEIMGNHTGKVKAYLRSIGY
mmetsp:Transcript_56507/g.104632  ORF Transcript_56507/g.104632 Transcript_56507/m.104632 type:complete len:163 (-) Transcript_56507:117-605(-)